MTKAFFIAGTATGVGKTTVACALSAYFSVTKKLDVGVMKPFEPGLSLRGKDSLPWDALSLKEASGSQDDLALINPYSFDAALSPDTAAELEHVWIDLENLDRIYQQLRRGHDILLVEGSGGVLTPLQRGFFVSDLIKRWNLPVIVVARLGIGTVNHTLLTCRFLKDEGIPISGVILNDLEGKPDASTRTNPDILARYLDVPLFSVYPHRKQTGPVNRESLAEVVEKHLDMRPVHD
jgi:dethiobiotin synthetase